MAQTWVIADYVTRAARECSLTPPSSWVSDTGGNTVKLQSFLKDVVDELLDRHEWNQVTDDQTITGTGVASYALASDFYRLCGHDQAVYETNPNRRPCIPVHTRGAWTELTTWNFAGGERYYRLQGSNIEFEEPLETSGSVTVAYVSKNWKTDLDGNSPGYTWSAETDLSLLPGRLLQLGLVWRWRKHKGLVWAAEKAEYESVLARYIGDDAPLRRVQTDTMRDPDQHPMRVPVPSTITVA